MLKRKEAVAHLQEMLCYYEHLSNEYMMSCKSADSIEGIEVTSLSFSGGG